MGRHGCLHLVSTSKSYSLKNTPYSTLCFLTSFSHHRVTIPPSSWIRSAHRTGTKILGTLIFEWKEGSEDLQKLDRQCADRLVDLCIERGFEGWLVNVEVELGVGGKGKREHAQRLIDWLRYLKEETGRRIVHGEIIWLAVTFIHSLLENDL